MKGAFIPGQDIVIPPLQPHHQILGMLQESPIIPGSAAFSTTNMGHGHAHGHGRAVQVDRIKPRVESAYGFSA
jgi:hypothetical protein